MPTTTFNPFSITIDEILYENNTEGEHIAVYQTSPLGLTITFNHQIVLSQKDVFFYNEMLIHPALFTHHHPKKIAIIGPQFGLLEEIIKHPQLSHITCLTSPTPLDLAIEQYCKPLYPPINDSRVTYIKEDPIHFLAEARAAFDIIIYAKPYTGQVRQERQLDRSLDQQAYGALNKEGILIKPCHFSWTAIDQLKTLFVSLKQAGFTDWQTLHFPEPHSLQGLRMVTMAKAHGLLNSAREKDIYNRSFSTHYYNFDTHKAALVIPEFMREAWE